MPRRNWRLLRSRKRIDGEVEERHCSPYGLFSPKVPKTIPFLLPGDETFDIGIDTRTGVNDKDYLVPFPFNGTIDKLTFNLGEVHLSAEEQTTIEKAVAIAKD